MTIEMGMMKGSIGWPLGSVLQFLHRLAEWRYWQYRWRAAEAHVQMSSLTVTLKCEAMLLIRAKGIGCMTEQVSSRVRFRVEGSWKQLRERGTMRWRKT